MSTLKEIKGSLKQAGFDKEDIAAALRLFLCLETIDKSVFPGSPVVLGFPINKSRFEYFAGHCSGKKAEEEYHIFINGLAELLREEKRDRLLWIPNLKKKSSRSRNKLLGQTWEELLVSIAVHEVRHRVQCDCSCKKFSPRSANLVEDMLLKSIIEFQESVFEEDKKIYIKERRSKAYIKGRINRAEFDAEVISRYIAVKIHGKNIYSLREEIASIIKMSAP